MTYRPRTHCHLPALDPSKILLIPRVERDHFGFSKNGAFRARECDHFGPVTFEKYCGFAHWGRDQLAHRTLPYHCVASQHLFNVGIWSNLQRLKVGKWDYARFQIPTICGMVNR